MKWRDQHETFKRLVISENIKDLNDLNRVLPFGCSVPTPKLEKWFRDLNRVSKELNGQPRWVNRFKLGADPEFVLDNQGVERMDAKNFRLHQGVAFGVDNNGRLVEIRPYPSRSALQVVASILETSRWMAATVENLLLYGWRSGAFLYGDGVGGHVHFGRKRPGLKIAVQALDQLEKELDELGVFPLQEILRRRMGDERHQHYGMPGDIRHQAHGYEYRTFAGWLDSPQLAYFILTLSKLVVYNPELFLNKRATVEATVSRLRNFLAYYRDVDDDARLCLVMIERMLPIHRGGDFKKAWGIDSKHVDPILYPAYIPSFIKPSPGAITDVLDLILNDRPLSWKPPVVTWSPYQLPEGYISCMEATATIGAKGLGELLWDTCYHRNFRLQFVNARDCGKMFKIPSLIAYSTCKNWKERCRQQVGTYEGHAIISEEHARVENLRACKEVLLNGVIPIWNVRTVQTDSLDKWLKAGQSSGLGDKSQVLFDSNSEEKEP
jgi:Phage phiEco32-like COOH.NH2 ligase-type 2